MNKDGIGKGGVSRFQRTRAGSVWLVSLRLEQSSLSESTIAVARVATSTSLNRLLEPPAGDTVRTSLELTHP